MQSNNVECSKTTSGMKLSNLRMDRKAFTKPRTVVIIDVTASAGYMTGQYLETPAARPKNGHMETDHGLLGVNLKISFHRIPGSLPENRDRLALTRPYSGGHWQSIFILACGCVLYRTFMHIGIHFSVNPARLQQCELKKKRHF